MVRQANGTATHNKWDSHEWGLLMLRQTNGTAARVRPVSNGDGRHCGIQMGQPRITNGTVTSGDY